LAAPTFLYFSSRPQPVQRWFQTTSPRSPRSRRKPFRDGLILLRKPASTVLQPLAIQREPFHTRRVAANPRPCTSNSFPARRPEGAVLPFRCAPAREVLRMPRSEYPARCRPPASLPEQPATRTWAP